MVHLTEPNHRFNIWNREEITSREIQNIRVEQPDTFYVPILNTEFSVYDRSFLAASIQVRFLTTHQNVHEWFILRMFSLTASASAIAVKFMNNDHFHSSINHWKIVKDYYSLNTPTREFTINLHSNDDLEWANEMLDDDDNWRWLESEVNVKRRFLQHVTLFK